MNIYALKMPQIRKLSARVDLYNFHKTYISDFV